jgi:hypothetical protein
MKKNEAANKMELDIQLFADTADNDSDENIKDDASVNTDNAGSDEELDFVDGNSNAEPTVTKEDDKKISTKAFSERLKREKEIIQRESEKTRLAELDKIAVSKGYKDWKDLEQFEKKEKLEKLGIEDADTFNSIIDDAVANNPVVLEAKKVIESQKEREQKAILDAAIAEISELDSDIKSINDLIALENYDEFYDLVEKGYSLPNAYKIIAFDKIANKKAASAAQTVITNINSKGHIKTTKGEQTKEITVPDEVLASYRKNNPDMTEDEIRKHYSKFIGGAKNE